MKTYSTFLAFTILGLAAGHADPFEKAHVTQTVESVSLVDQQKSAAHVAKIGDTVTSENGVQTGAKSRAELTFPDQTILRLGADAFFSFKAGGRSMTLQNGSMLFSSPAGEGGGQVQAGSVTASVTGTNFLFSLLKNGDVQLVVLEGKVFLYFTANPTVKREFKAGQLISIPKGDKVIGFPITINLKQFIATNALLGASSFPPLPVQALLNHIADIQFQSTAAPTKAQITEVKKAITKDLGKPIQASTASELAAEAAKADPTAGPAVAAAIAEALDSSDESKTKIAAVITALADKGTDSSFLAAVQAACAANPDLAVSIAVAAAKARPDLVVQIAYAAVKGAPSQGVAIQDALTALFPDLADQIAAAVKQALGELTDAGIPGFTSETQQNPGVYASPSPSPTSTPGPTPNPGNTGGDVISGE